MRQRGTLSRRPCPFDVMREPTASYAEIAARHGVSAATLLRSVLLVARHAESQPSTATQLLERFRANLLTAGDASGPQLLRLNSELHALLTQPFAAFAEAHLDAALGDLHAGALLDHKD